LDSSFNKAKDLPGSPRAFSMQCVYVKSSKEEDKKKHEEEVILEMLP
jgi:hypothetical protein